MAWKNKGAQQLMANPKYNQNKAIADHMMSLMDKGMKDKSEIFTKVVEDLGVPRPTVRRVSRDLRESLELKAKILAPTSEDIKRSKPFS